MSASRISIRARGWAGAALTGLLLGLLALGPGLRRGYLLSYDMVFVPHPPFNAAMFGLAGSPPRAVPSDLVVAVLSRALSADIVQKSLLLAIFVLACSGVAELLSDEPRPARLAGGAFYAWNPFVAERLIIGQWALLLGYAGLPWVLRSLTVPSATRWGRAGRLLLALVPAAAGGFSAVCISALVVIPVTLATGRDARARAQSLALALGVLALVSLPWLVSALASPVLTSPAGVAAFAARADTPFGSVGSLLMLGGIWNAQVVPTGYGGLSSVIWLAGVLAALVCFAVVGRRRWPGLSAAGAVGLAIACIGLTGAGRAALRTAITFWPGFAVLRDAQQFVAPLALVVATGIGLGVARLIGSVRLFRGREGRALVGALVIIAPVAALPGLAWGAAGRLTSVSYPADWIAARTLIDGDHVAGRVLVLPWASYRRFGWNHGEAVLDPWPRLLRRDVIWDDGVQVGSLAMPAENPLARSLNGLISSRAPMTQRLLAAGVRYVIVDAGQPPIDDPGTGRRWPGAASYRSRLPGCRLVLDGPDLLVYRLPPHGPAG